MNRFSNIKKTLAFTMAVLALMISNAILPSGSSARSAVSFPVLKAGQDYKNVEVRQGKGFPAYDQMTVIYSGAVSKGKAWSGEEGERICAKATNNPCRRTIRL